MEVADAAANAVEARYNTQWDRGSICEVICTCIITLLGVPRTSQALNVYCIGAVCLSVLARRLSQRNFIMFHCCT